jgi:hypothetical protein
VAHHHIENPVTIQHTPNKTSAMEPNPFSPINAPQGFVVELQLKLSTTTADRNFQIYL